MKILSKIYIAVFDIGHVVCLCDYFFVCQSAFSDFLACGAKQVKKIQFTHEEEHLHNHSAEKTLNTRVLK